MFENQVAYIFKPVDWSSSVLGKLVLALLLIDVFRNVFCQLPVMGTDHFRDDFHIIYRGLFIFSCFSYSSSNPNDVYNLGNGLWNIFH